MLDAACRSAAAMQSLVRGARRLLDHNHHCLSTIRLTERSPAGISHELPRDYRSVIWENAHGSSADRIAKTKCLTVIAALSNRVGSLNVTFGAMEQRYQFEDGQAC